MKLIITSVSVLAATTVAATAQLTGISTNLVTGVKQLGLITPDPSTCGVIGAFALVAIISARRFRVKS